jgi:cytoskeletal protein CcmA (bactofilin family)
MGFFSRRNDPDPHDDETAHNEGDSVAPPAPPITADTPPEKADRIFDTALGAGSNLDGSLSSDGNVRLDGAFKGTLNIKENVLVGVTAEIEADISAKNITVAGSVHGDLTGKKIHLLATAQIRGDITAEALITEDGAFIDGRISMIEAGTTDISTDTDTFTPDDIATPDDEDAPL